MNSSPALRVCGSIRWITLAFLIVFASMGIGQALASSGAKIPAVPRAEARAPKPAPAKTNKSTSATLKGARKDAGSAVEQAYWELCRRRINGASDPGVLAVLARDADAFGQSHKNSPFGARALVMAGEIEAEVGDFKGAMENYQKAEVIFRVNSGWKEGRQYLSYINLRTGDALAGSNNHLGALTMWKRTFTSWPDSPLAGQCLAKIVETTAKVLPPKQAWSENNRFLSDALRLANLSPEARDAAQIARLQVLAGAADRGLYPPGELMGEIDRFLAASPPGKRPAIDKARGSLERLRANAAAAARTRPAPPQSFFRKLAEMIPPTTSTVPTTSTTSTLSTSSTLSTTSTLSTSSTASTTSTTSTVSPAAPPARAFEDDAEIEARAHADARKNRSR